jgi:hypothetical protein
MRDTPLPLALLAVLGVVLVVLLFNADEALEKIARASTQTRAAAPALATHVASEPVHAAQPRAQVMPEHPMRIEPAALAARAETPPTKKRVTRTQRPVEYRQNNALSHREFGLSGLR